MAQFIDNRAAAEKEARAEIMRGRKTGAVPALAAKVRRDLAEQAAKAMKEWEAKGDITKATQCYRVMAGHIAIARAWDIESMRPRYRKAAK